jgi:hypothetical protein
MRIAPGFGNVSWKKVECASVTGENWRRQVAHGALPHTPAIQHLATATVPVQSVLRLAEQAPDKGLARGVGELEGCRHQLVILEVVGAISTEQKFRWSKLRNDGKTVLLRRLRLIARR